MAAAQSAGIDWDPGLWRATIADTGLFVNGAVPAALTDTVAGHLGGAFHHARYDHGAGFCSVNGLVVAARAFQRQGGGKVLILDLDAHCGGGTESLLTRHQLDGVHHLDIAVSRYGFDRYEPRHGTLDRVSIADYYLPRLEHRLGELPAGFELVLYFAGMDVHNGSTPGGMDYADDALLAAREEIVFNWCRQNKLPVAFTIGGGYPGPHLTQEQLVDLHRLTILSALRG